MVKRLGFPKTYNFSRKLCQKTFKQFGKNAEFRKGAFAVACENISIGNNVTIRTNCMLFGEGGITIENNALIGNSVHIYTSKHRYENNKKNILLQGYELDKGVILKQGCWIGSCSIILPGITIGKNAVIGAGSVITKSVPDGESWAGNPAKPLSKKEAGK